MNLSIIVPVYNVEKYCAATLKSLISQREKEFEIIIVDDGSSDKTISTIEEIFKKSTFKNYKIFKQENSGVSSARNRGLSESQGKYVMFLDGDDYVSEDLVKNIYCCMGEQEMEVLCWGYNTVKEDKTVIINYIHRFGLNPENNCLTGIETLKKIILEKAMWIWTGSAAYSREFLLENNFKYTPGCFCGEDQEFTYKALSRAKKVYFINKVLSFYVQREGSISNRYDLKKFDIIGALKRTCEYLNNIPGEDLNEVINELNTKKIIINYFNALESCLYYSHRKNIGVLLREIDEKYPQLNKEMIKTMKAVPRKNNKISRKIKYYLISPSLYYAWVKKPFVQPGD
ncbi:glycosyltransferase family 2 protein [Candidatus Contubernalis alkaliaceticus]|uniref:glycosyltransferase family 2 protein n=1 Tax=Candidatus Contubernalis alkaliaceticus TaxID=338645 RepID=UPI001F4BE9CF|nr:glycosyltransferase family A protein [Candidatus Contubernalis alkalaceticus]UNC93592.1 glycosyltransferase family 2 protein [Candidatus Contubernalis alkalaceticus]